MLEGCSSRRDQSIVKCGLFTAHSRLKILKMQKQTEIPLSPNNESFSESVGVRI